MRRRRTKMLNELRKKWKNANDDEKEAMKAEGD